MNLFFASDKTIFNRSFSRFSAVSWILHSLEFRKRAFLGKEQNETVSETNPFYLLQKTKTVCLVTSIFINIYDTPNMCSFHFWYLILDILLFELTMLLNDSFFASPFMSNIFSFNFFILLKRHVLILLDVHFFVKIIGILSTRDWREEKKRRTL